MARVDAKILMEARFQTGKTGGQKTPGQDPKIAGVNQSTSLIQDASPMDAVSVTKQNRKTAILVSPFMSEDPATATKAYRYAMRAVQDSLRRGEAPMATHAFFYDSLSYKNPVERDMGLQCQISWLKKAEMLIVYTDGGITPAMQTIINSGEIKNKRIEYRTIGSFT
ncbi:DUF4406-domain protein [Stenotrophomonas maltophilia phage vB_SmaM_Ps15]|uniref:DUF4406-domain protein n=1 Tax=Stenotrophomonas maltophilia phage vB_SmaM_Ps15 TaxID=3071007 RepID=A0AAE9FHM2_9CAUD|nr:DUF4406-domain protein [Stenotrophomonas maltophilia phage vB_SmaM_Ps15]UMO77363.1 DUF4406-domain protein [Stenotrophomonas maltophilia phage vB_SmaM_Ps15]